VLFSQPYAPVVQDEMESVTVNQEVAASNPAGRIINMSREFTPGFFNKTVFYQNCPQIAVYEYRSLKLLQ
jgi:hypothetical protein